MRVKERTAESGLTPRRVTQPEARPSAGANRLEVAIRPDEGIDPRWDTLVERATGGHHVQTTSWAKVKRTVGWRAVRIEVLRQGELVGGCQLLLRKIGGVGSVGFVPRGPVIAEAAPPEVGAAALSGLEAAARSERVLYLKVQPPAGSEDMAATLRDRGYSESAVETAPTATVLVDLQRDAEDILAGMRTNTRRNIRRGLRSGVVVRSGDGADITMLHELVRATAQRQGFAPYPERYYQAMWDLFSRRGQAHLLVAEQAGMPLSAVLLIAFRHTVLYKIGGWSGEARETRPNELLHWEAIEWAKRAGHLWYDLEGIDLSAARAVVDGADPPSTPTDGVSHFKLGFGGTVAIFPPAYDHAGGGIAGRAVGALAPVLERLSPIAARILGRRA
jgi:lipid II:glycine glycyltransferase (peptidoglycan interpeptide bridge formation enzyme)